LYRFAFVGVISCNILYNDVPLGTAQCPPKFMTGLLRIAPLIKVFLSYMVFNLSVFLRRPCCSRLPYRTTCMLTVKAF